MTLSSDPDALNLEQILGQLLPLVPSDQQPLLIAALERLAARRYRDWAADAAMHDGRAALLACADREDAIAGRVEALYPNAEATVRAMLADHPDIAELNRTIFAGRPLAEQFAIQARAERLGARTWRALAAADPAPSRRDVFLGCADLEEQNARTLDELLAHDRAR